ncbi:MAG: endonuclease/exonuclease/phosphatase family protein [Anaerolineales bacterium]
MKDRIFDVLRRYLVAAAWAYFTFLFLWAGGFLIAGDRFPIIALANIAALYLFAPLVAVFLIGLVTRRRELWAGLAVGALLFVFLWGVFFLPRARSVTNEETLTVMSYNTLGYQHNVCPIIDLLSAESPDVVFIQELNTTLQAAIEDDLAAEYPHRIFDPVDDPTGMGVISKYPVRESGDSLPLSWVGVPQVLTLDWRGQEVRLINFHMWPVTILPLKYSSLNYRAREAQALYLADYARVTSWETPVIAAGDANVTHLSDAYRLITDVLADAWREAGQGFGHTYPGGNVHRKEPEGIGRWRGPRWVVRIDYIFHSDHWQTVEARLARSNGVSDHRAVIAELILSESAVPGEFASRP